MKQKTKLYTIPLNDQKHILYAPLKPLALIVNNAMINKVASILDSEIEIAEHDEIMNSLKNIGLFDKDVFSFSDCNCDKPFKPSQCILMLTTGCNLACTYCYAARDQSKPVVLQWPVAKRTIDIVFENSRKRTGGGPFSVSFHGGGEPTLPRSLFIQACEYARSLDPKCPLSVTTNAVWDDEFREKALDLLTEVSISLDGNELTQNRQRPDKNGNGTFATVMETIAEIEKRKIHFGIRMTVTWESLPELKNNVEFLCDHTTCRTFQVEPVYNQGRAVGSGLNIDDVGVFVDTFMDAWTLAKSKGKTLYYSGARPHIRTNTFCRATSEVLIVTSHGELTACYEVFDRTHILADDFIIGDLDQEKGIILYPGKREALLKKISDNRDQCEGCFCFYHCAGDCPPKAFIANLNNDEFRCLVTREITKELILERIAAGDGIWQGDAIHKS